MLGLNGGARENWPRIGLEAMAAGVPLVCQNQWGWKEMIEDGQTGFLTNSDEEMAFRLAQLAYDEDLRQAIIERARASPRSGLPGADREAVVAVVREFGGVMKESDGSDGSDRFFRSEPCPGS